MTIDQNTKDGMRKEIEKMKVSLKSMREHLGNVNDSDKARKFLMESEMLLLMSIDAIKKIGVQEEVIQEKKEEVVPEKKEEVKEDKSEVKENA